MRLPEFGMKMVNPTPQQVIAGLAQIELKKQLWEEKVERLQMKCFARTAYNNRHILCAWLTKDYTRRGGEHIS